MNRRPRGRGGADSSPMTYAAFIVTSTKDTRWLAQFPYVYVCGPLWLTLDRDNGGSQRWRKAQ
jgi:hypothetical protein